MVNVHPRWKGIIIEKDLNKQFLPLFLFVSSVEVWGSTALIQDSRPRLLYVDILYYLFVL